MMASRDPAKTKTRSVDRVKEYFAQRGVEIHVQELDASTRTAQLAAQAVGTTLGSICKSLVFITDDDRTVLALVAGDQRADDQKVARLVNAQKVRMASGEQVRARTSYAIGGVPPVAHATGGAPSVAHVTGGAPSVAHVTPLETLVDQTLLRFDKVWAAAGAPNALFGIEIKKLIELTRGRVEDIVVAREK